MVFNGLASNVVSDASANAMRNSWFLSESAVTGADETLTTNIDAVFPYSVEVHINQWMEPEKTKDGGEARDSGRRKRTRKG